MALMNSFINDKKYFILCIDKGIFRVYDTTIIIHINLIGIIWI